GLQILLLYIPVLAQFFGLHPLPARELAICFGFSALMFAWLEAEKLVIQLSRRRKQPSIPVSKSVL
ncbi:MAG: cation transporting ATPase C-terminal domain-containing protein, partial [Nodosilinea sp.]